MERPARPRRPAQPTRPLSAVPAAEQLWPWVRLLRRAGNRPSVCPVPARRGPAPRRCGSCPCWRARAVPVARCRRSGTRRKSGGAVTPAPPADEPGFATTTREGRDPRLQRGQELCSPRQGLTVLPAGGQKAGDHGDFSTNHPVLWNFMVFRVSSPSQLCPSGT